MFDDNSVFNSSRMLGSYIDLVVAKALLHLVEQAAVGQLAEGRQVVVWSWRHQFNLRKDEKDLQLEEERILQNKLSVYPIIMQN